MRRTDSRDTEIGILLQIVINLSFFYADEELMSHAFCRVNAYTSKALIRGDFAGIRVGHCVSGLIEKAINKKPDGPHTAQLVFPMGFFIVDRFSYRFPFSSLSNGPFQNSAWHRCSAQDWFLLSPCSFSNGGFRLGPARIPHLPILHSRNFPDPASDPRMSSSIAPQPISSHRLSFHRAPPPPPKAAPNAPAPFTAPFGPPPAYPRDDPVTAPASPANASGQRLIPANGPDRNRRAHF